ncbi:alpha/beta fold hydrolase [Paenibacillus beijingensis]|uniref:alpha/beta fold hydrolase n=1 Tax=Paenibacillus beijingensis TaxID=1126833 RepID=UPI001EE76D75|nr:alpha/beta hydrolase [Paenibacillus beijingensis]
MKIPSESMEFIVKNEFPTMSKEDIANKNNLNLSLRKSTLPFVISDLDYRLSHRGRAAYDHFSYRRVGNLTALEREGRGIPIIILHGTFSGSDCLIPLANSLQPFPIWLVDLPGFGRSPYHHSPDTIDGYINSVVDFILSFQSPVILVGHSFGGLIASQAMEKIQERIQQLILLQPVLHPARFSYRSSFLTKAFLSLMNKSMFKKKLLSTGSFINEHEVPDHYLDYVMEDLRSPRVRASTAEVMSALSKPNSFQLNLDRLDPNQLHVLWGDQDRDYSIPNLLERDHITLLPFGHQFPISHPEITAQWIQKWIE